MITNPPLSESLVDIKSQVLSKANIILNIMGKETIKIPVGREWTDNKFWHGLLLKEISFQTPNEETSLVSVIGVAGSKCDAHYHENTETILVASGEIYCPVVNKRVVSGGIWAIQPGEVHSIEFIKDSLLVVMWHPRFGYMNDSIADE